MAGRHSFQQLTAFTLDGNNHLAHIESADFDQSITEVDGASGAASDESATEVKRGTTFNFNLKVDNGSGAPMTSAQISTETVDARSTIGVCKSFSIAVNNRTEDGSGHGNLDMYPVAVRRKVTAQLTEVVDLSGTTPDLITASNSNTPADRAMIIDLNFGAARVTMPTRLTKAQESDSEGALTKINASFSKSGAITTPSSGTNIYAVALIGDALITVSWQKTIGSDVRTYSATGVITSLTVSVEDGQIVKASGSIELQGPLTIGVA